MFDCVARFETWGRVKFEFWVLDRASGPGMHLHAQTLYGVVGMLELTNPKIIAIIGSRLGTGQAPGPGGYLVPVRAAGRVVRP